MNDFASNSLLFNTSQAAYAIAYTLEGEWDGCNGVVLSSEIDENVIEVAIALVAQDLKEKIKSCPLGEYCTLLFPTLTMGKVLSESQQWFLTYARTAGIRDLLLTFPLKTIPKSFVY
ncbi:MAG: hypothetical protein HC847_20250 [Hydrococcus sp. RU_2_2]|nr:hypothetical protein [Hydrococcus sp. RU_2_2]